MNATVAGRHPLVGDRDVWAEGSPRPEPGAVIEATYDYVSASGAPLFQIVRFRPKSFLTRHVLADGTVRWGRPDVGAALYRLPQVLAAHTVLLLEGEKDVATAERVGLPPGWAASCNPFGACAWRPDYTASLAGKTVVFCPDTDFYGQEHLTIVAIALARHAAAMALVRLPGGAKDLSEWVEAGGTAPMLAALLRDAEPLTYPRPDDERMRSVAPLSLALERLLALRAVSGTADGAPATLRPDQVAPMFPDWVGEHADGTPFLAIRGFEPLLTTALRELREERVRTAARADAIAARLDAGVPREP